MQKYVFCIDSMSVMILISAVIDGVRGLFATDRLCDNDSTDAAENGSNNAPEDNTNVLSSRIPPVEHTQRSCVSLSDIQVCIQHSLLSKQDSHLS